MAEDRRQVDQRTGGGGPRNLGIGSTVYEDSAATKNHLRNSVRKCDSDQVPGLSRSKAA